MNDQQIIKELKERLNDEGSKWHLQFAVSRSMSQDGDWWIVFVSHNATRENGAAARQIIADVEREVTGAAGRELLLVPVSKLEDAA
ncbi:MAG: hypothetical protein H3C58_14655 [Fimbriimonadaceae bacterium]|nr:hypothetical protein [Fimbriimonadaceae bacterium]